MARGAIPVVTNTANTAAVATQTIQAGGITGAAGLYIPASANVDEKCVLVIRETANGATGTVWIKAGDSDSVSNAGQGDLTITVGGSAVISTVLERERFGQGATGTIDVDSGITGIFTVFKA